jgi:hypothetical protein
METMQVNADVNEFRKMYSDNIWTQEYNQIITYCNYIGVSHRC